MSYDVNVQLVDFPVAGGKEMVIKNEDDSFTILINAQLSYEEQVAAYEHALRHIENCDFDDIDGDVQQIELSAHSI